MNQGDVNKAQSVATQAARPNLVTMLKDNKPSSTGFTLGEPLVKDDTAEVPERVVGEFFGAALGELTKGLKSAEKTAPK